MTIGVLALQGSYAEHIAVLEAMKVNCCEVKTIQDLKNITGLILPGGESTTMSKLLHSTGLFEAIKQRIHKRSLPILGTCAGAILLAKNVTGKNAPKSLGCIDMTVDRNAYGTQLQSFRSHIAIKGLDKPMPAAFIRAPVITHVGPNVEVLAEHEGNPVLVQEGNILAATFHTEVTDQLVIHRWFIQSV